MVKLHTSLLAIALAMGSALASSNKFQRREFDNQVQLSGSHFHHCSTTLGGFGDEPDEDIFDDLEAREPQGLAGAAIIARFASNIAARHLDKVVQASNIVSSMAMAASMIPSKKSSQDQSYSRRELEDNEGPFERDLDVEELFRRESYPLAERDVIDNGDLFVRDFGSEELYGRGYDLLDERDIIDNEDLFVRDLEAGEFFGREYDSYFLD